MIQVGQIVRYWLLSKSAITAIAAQRIYANTLPWNVEIETLSPSVVVESVTEFNEYDDCQNAVSASVDFYIYSSTSAASADSLLSAIDDAIQIRYHQDFTTDGKTYRIKACYRDGNILHEQDQETRLHIITATYIIKIMTIA